MIDKTMTTLKNSLEQLGDLHDARVMSIRWDANLRDLEFTFEDVYANFRGLANYPAREQGGTVLRHVKELVIDMAVDGNGGAHVYEFTVEELQSEFVATVLFRPSGKITAKFTS